MEKEKDWLVSTITQSIKTLLSSEAPLKEKKRSYFGNKESFFKKEILELYLNEICWTTLWYYCCFEIIDKSLDDLTIDIAF